MIYKCKMCGGPLNVTDKVTVAKCPYCKETQTFPQIDDEIRNNLFNRANELRLACEFDKSASVYERLIEEGCHDSEAYWGIVLCKYGIEYVEDYATHRRLPTCHRVQYESIAADTDFRSAYTNADAYQQQVYLDQAKDIARIQKAILKIANEEDPFDVFICYKEKDEYGRRTIDSQRASELYYELTKEGFKVFYSAITLENHLGEDYEPYIFAALNSAKVMLVVGTKPEYFNAVWVKNEWSRFLKMTKTDHTKKIIPCYANMDPYNLPEEFAHLQAQDMSKIGFVNDVAAGIKKILLQDTSGQVSIETVVVNSVASSNTAPLLERAFMFCEDGEWSNATKYFEKVLDQEPKNAEAYLGKLMAELQIRKREQLKNCKSPIDTNSNYQKAVRFGDEKLCNELKEYNSFIIERNNHEAYEKGLKKQNEDSISSLNEAVLIFSRIREYKDSEDRIIQCQKHLEEHKRISEQKRLEEERLAQKNRLEAERIAQEKRLEEERKSLEKRLEEERIAQEKRKEAEKAAKKRKRIKVAVVLVLCAGISFVIMMTKIVIPNQEKAAFIAEYGQEVYNQFGVAEIGNTVKWADIDWLVIDENVDSRLLISKNIIGRREYNYRDTSTTWEDCTLRSFLNGTWYDKTFDDEQKTHIQTTTVVTSDYFETDGGNDTQDKVFLLSTQEAKRYFSSNFARKAKYNGKRYGWWLRSPGERSNRAAVVKYNGGIDRKGYRVNTDVLSRISGIRPALWVNLIS